jgi:probable rRNA maturation factor
VIVVDQDGRRLRVPRLATWLSRIAPVRARGAVTVALVSDARIRRLNRMYRGKDYATDVLSFGVGTDGEKGRRGGKGRRAGKGGTGGTGGKGGNAGNAGNGRTAGRGRNRGGSPVQPLQPVQPFPPSLGDIVIARGVARRQASIAGHSDLAELKVLALHGLLHLLGYDHEGDNGRMQRVERHLRRKGGLRAGVIERAAG